MSALSSLETTTLTAVNSTIHKHVNINCCIVMSAGATHYHGNSDDMFSCYIIFQLIN